MVMLTNNGQMPGKYDLRYRINAGDEPKLK
jgi:hypothetical protein